jgi:hypothetical protein
MAIKQFSVASLLGAVVLSDLIGESNALPIPKGQDVSDAFNALQHSQPG